MYPFVLFLYAILLLPLTLSELWASFLPFLCVCLNCTLKLKLPIMNIDSRDQDNTYASDTSPLKLYPQSFKDLAIREV